MNKAFSVRNRTRCEATNGFNHPLGSWSASDWMVACFGELGEAANVLKKLNRVRDGICGNKETEDVLRRKLSLELADAYIYLDLFCQSQGVDLEAAVNEAFEAKSKQIGYDDHARENAELRDAALEKAEAVASELLAALQAIDGYDARRMKDFISARHIFVPDGKSMRQSIVDFALDKQTRIETVPPKEKNQNVK
jgi:NTP pyrophosphatase (non-canonical NTP hydrolase)